MREPAKTHQFILLLLCSTFGVQILISSLPWTFILVAGQMISLLLPLLGYVALTGGGFKTRLGLKPFKAQVLLQGLGITLLLQPFLMLLAGWVERFTGNPMISLAEQLTVTPVWATVTGLAIMPALIEELVFRGLLLTSYRHLPLSSAALLNGAVFGMFHMNAYQFSYALVLGVFFTVITRRSGSVIPAMGMHFLNNLISVILIYQWDSSWYGGLDSLLKAATAPGPGMLWGALAAGASLSAAMWLLQRIKQEESAIFQAEEPVSDTPAGLMDDWPVMFLFLVFTVVALFPLVSGILKI